MFQVRNSTKRWQFCMNRRIYLRMKNILLKLKRKRKRSEIYENYSRLSSARFALGQSHRMAQESLFQRCLWVHLNDSDNLKAGLCQETSSQSNLSSRETQNGISVFTLFVPVEGECWIWTVCSWRAWWWVWTQLNKDGNMKRPREI